MMYIFLQYVNPSLSHQILQYDPTETTDYDTPVEVINKYLDGET
jgi:hypothetical protein